VKQALILAVMFLPKGLSAQIPRIFAPGVVSTADPEFSVSFTPDGSTVYFNRMTADRSRMFALESHLVNGQWQQPRPVSFADTVYRYVDISVSPLGDQIFFSSNRPVGTGPAKPDFDSWVMTRLATAPTSLPAPVNTDKQEVFVSATRDRTLYFTSDRGGNNDIYRARTLSGTYGVERLPDLINTPGSESNPLIAPDESFLIFVAERPEGLGAADLYVSHRVNGTWTAPRNLGAPVNSTYADFAPGLSPDGTYLFFTSERPGIVADSVTGRRPGDIYQEDVRDIPALRH
jgi:Tol biopolymer transport system component